MNLAFNRFELREELGRGLSATVHRAFDRKRGHEVALKVFSSPPWICGPIRAAFAGLRACMPLRNSGIVIVYELDEQEGWAALELIQGSSLRSFLAKNGRARSTHACLKLGRSLADALSVVHANRLCHGDVSPGNVLLREIGTGVLTDFLGPPSNDAREEPLGTPRYVAPEILQGEPRSAAGDIWSLGALLWECVTGQPLRKRADLDPRNPPTGQPAWPPEFLAREEHPPTDFLDDIRWALAPVPHLRPSAATWAARLKELTPPD